MPPRVLASGPKPCGGNKDLSFLGINVNNPLLCPLSSVERRPLAWEALIEARKRALCHCKRPGVLFDCIYFFKLSRHSVAVSRLSQSFLSPSLIVN